MVKMVAQYQRTCTNQLGPHGHCVNERPGGCAQFNFPSEAKEAVRAPWINCHCLEVFKIGTLGAPWELKLTTRSASILALASRPKFLEVLHSRASCPTATCSRQSVPSSQNSRREDGPMSLPPGALELMSYDPLLGRCRKRRDFVQSPTRNRLQRADPKKAVYPWADNSGRRPFRARTL
jgi:hypothetical protein